MRPLLVSALLLSACSDVRDSTRVTLLRPPGIGAGDWVRCEELVAQALELPWAEMPPSDSAGYAPVRGPLRAFMLKTSMREAWGALSEVDMQCLRERLMRSCGVYHIVANEPDAVVGNLNSTVFQDAMERRADAMCGERSMDFRMVAHIVGRSMADKRWVACE